MRTVFVRPSCFLFHHQLNHAVQDLVHYSTCSLGICGSRDYLWSTLLSLGPSITDIQVSHSYRIHSHSLIQHSNKSFFRRLTIGILNVGLLTTMFTTSILVVVSNFMCSLRLSVQTRATGHHDAYTRARWYTRIIAR